MLRCVGKPNLECATCKKIFKNAAAKRQHLRKVNCKAFVYKELDIEDDDDSEIEADDDFSKCMSRVELRDEIIKLRSKETNGGININTNHTNNNNTNHINNGTIMNTGITMNHYLKPNIDFLNNKEYMHNLLKKSKYRTNKVIMSAVRDTYNSDERPENRSIKINLKSGFAEVNMGKKTITVPNDDACYDVISNLSKDLKRVIEDYSYEYNMSGSKVDDVIDEMEDVECDNVDSRRLYGSYVKAGLM
jgi:hypothetical protein